jgi:hypothetical protein
MNIDETKQNVVEEDKEEYLDAQSEGVNEEKTISEEDKTSKKGIFGELKKVANKGIDLAKHGVEKGIDLGKEGYSKAKDKYEENKLNKEELREYEKTYNDKTYLFQIKGTFNNKGILETIRAFRDSSNQILYIPLIEQNIKYVKSKSNLVNVSDESEIEIQFIESKNVSLREMIVSEEKKYDVQCFEAKYDYVKIQQPTNISNISNVVNQSVNVSGHNAGDINLVSNIEVQLENLMSEVKGVKTKLFSKEKKAHDEAIKIIGPVKDTIINGKKDKTLIQRFFDLLIVFSPALAESFKTFM